MILVGDGSAEKRENSIAGGLDDVTDVTAHRVDHQLQRRIDDRSSLFRVEVLLEVRTT
jgi:hypothetical protein